jgi:hypothetical protein
MNWKTWTAVSAGIAAVAFSGCGGGGGSTTPAPMNNAACASMSGCVATANGFQFPDGNGGTVSCTNGVCSDNTSYNSGYSSGYSDGTTAAGTGGYNQGYSDGQTAGYNQGYSDGYNDGYSDGYSDGSSGNSVAGGTKDVDLQKADYQSKTQDQRAQYIANQFQMSVSSALQLTQLSDKVVQMTKTNQMTGADRDAVTKSALGIAGISTDEVNDAFQKSMNGDTGAADDLLEKAAKNLGMSSSASLRDQLLPALGVSMD